MCSFDRHEEIAKIIKILQEIDGEQKNTAIVAPKFNSNKLRVYSYGGYVLELSTTIKAKNKIFPNKGWSLEKYGVEKRGTISYSELDEKTLRNMIDIAKTRSDGNDGAGKIYRERSVETKLMVRNRESKHGNGILIDMEYQAPKAWVKKIASYKGKTTTGKADLIVYDKKNKSFGIVELKYNNKSCDNMEKHFADFYNMIHSEKAVDIKKEFCRRMRYLMEYNLLEKVDENDLTEAINNPIWNAFLFVDGDETDSKDNFEKDLIDTKYIKRDEVGYQYVANMDDDIDYSQDKFFQYLR